MAALLVILLSSAMVAVKVWSRPPAAKFAGLSPASVPNEVDGYLGMGEAPIAPEVQAALASASIVSRSFVRGVDSIDFLAIAGTDRTALHDPRSCLVGAGWRLQDDHDFYLPASKVTAHSCHAVGPAGTQDLDIIYLYAVDGKIISQPTEIRAAMLWSALIGRKNSPAYFLRFVQTKCTDEKADQARHANLTKFAARMFAAMQPTILPNHTS